jgi:hypothetical protein
MSTRSSARKQAAGGAAGPASAEKRAKLSNGAAAASASAPAIEPVGKDVKKGSDTDGAAYASVDELWKAHFSDPASAALDAPKIAWYQKGADYWMTQEATVDGVLGGFGHVSPVDVQGSKAFLQKIPGVRFDRAIDCGAGIGRISRALLCPLFKEVDLVEQNPVYVQKAREYCVAPAATHPKAMRHYFVEGLQTFSFASLPEESKAAAAASAAAADAVPNERGPYDVVWIQYDFSFASTAAAAAAYSSPALCVRILTCPYVLLLLLRSLLCLSLSLPFCPSLSAPCCCAAGG